MGFLVQGLQYRPKATSNMLVHQCISCYDISWTFCVFHWPYHCNNSSSHLFGILVWGDCTSTPKQGCVIGVTGKYFTISSGYLQGEMTTVHAVTVSEEKVCDLFARFLAFVISVPVCSIFFLKDTYSMEKTQHWPKAACMSFPCLSEFGLHIL